MLAVLLNSFTWEDEKTEEGSPLQRDLASLPFVAAGTRILCRLQL